MKIKLLIHQGFPQPGLKIIRSSLKEHSSSTIELPPLPDPKLNTIDISSECKYNSEELVALLRNIDSGLSRLDDSYKVFFRGMDANFALKRTSYDLDLAIGRRYEFSSLEEMIDRYLSFCQEKTMIICPFIDSSGDIPTKKLGEGYWLLELKENGPHGRHKIALGLVVQDVKAHIDDSLLHSLDHCVELFFLYFFLYLGKDIEPQDLMFAKVKIDGSSIKLLEPLKESDDLFLDDCHGYKDSVDYSFKNSQYIATPETIDQLPANNIYKLSPLIAATRRRYGQQSPLHIAMTSFDAAYTSEIWHDEIRLIMITTALEALFSISNSELKYRLSSNIAWFLQPEPQNYIKRKSIISRMSKIYDFRSGVIHGTKLKGIPELGAKKEKGYIDDAFSLFREIILHAANTDRLRHFETVASKKQFIEMLQVGHIIS